MNLLVIGAGAIGSILAGYISQSSEHNILLADAWIDHIEAIMKDGLVVNGIRGDHKFVVPAVQLESLARADTTQWDVVFIAVKSHDTQRILGYVKPLLRDSTVIVSTQNGLNEEAIAEVAGPEHVLGAVTEIGGHLVGPGRVIETRDNGGFVVGELTGNVSSRASQLASIMSLCAPTIISPNINGVLWSKLMWNCMLNPLSALTGMGQGEIVADGRLRRLAFKIAEEVAAVAAAQGVQLEPLTFLGINPRLFVVADDVARSRAEGELIERYSSQMKKTTSMSQDIMKGRSTEVDYLNGYVARKGHQLGVPTALNLRIVELIHAIEHGRLSSNPQNIERLEAPRVPPGVLATES